MNIIAISIGVALAVHILHDQTIDVASIIRSALLLISTLSLLNNYAPKVFQWTTVGIGHHIGTSMTELKNNNQ